MALVADVREKSTGTGNFPKYVGYFEGEVVGINPTAEEYFDIYGVEPKKELKYLKEEDGVKKADIVVVLKEVSKGNLFQLRFFLKDLPKVGSKSGKMQYINNVGTCGWAFDEEGLQSWFLKDGDGSTRSFRQAYEGEENFLKFLRTWLGNLDFRKPGAQLQIDWKKVINGNLTEWKQYIGHDYTTPIGAMATVNIKDDGSTQQSVFAGTFFPHYQMKSLRVSTWDDDKIQGLKFKKLAPHEYFIRDIVGEYGPKDYYVLEPLKEYDPNVSPENNKVLSVDDSEF
jgi:hypothetical protein